MAIVVETAKFVSSERVEDHAGPELPVDGTWAELPRSEWNRFDG